jgi:hypothetical protein
VEEVKKKTGRKISIITYMAGGVFKMKDNNMGFVLRA